MTPEQCVVLITVSVIGALTCAWQARRAIRAMREDDQRTRNDRTMARRYAHHRPTPEQQQPGTDYQLYLDCIAVYGEQPGIDRLLNDIHQHRKEKP